MSKDFRAKLQPSEMAIFRSASDIYAAHVSVGHVAEGSEDEYIKKSISVSLKICDIVERKVVSDDELG
jgi:hypothetical protein